MSKRIEPSKEVIDQIKELYEKEQLSDRKIAEKVGYKRDVIKRIIREEGFRRTDKDLCPDLTEEKLRALYVDKKKSVREIMEITGYSKNTIVKQMNKFGIKRRHNSDKIILFLPDDLRRLYVDENLTQRQIAERYNCSVTTVSKILRYYEISKWTKTFITIPTAILVLMFVDKCLSVSEIAATLQCPKSTIRNRLIELGLITYKNYNGVNIKEVLDLCEEGKSVKELANIFKCSKGKISRILQNYGANTQACSLEKVNYKELYEKLVNQKRKREDVAHEYGVSSTTLYNKMKELGINLYEDRYTEITKELLEDFYYRQGMRQEDIAAELEVSRSVIVRKFKEYGIHKQFKYGFITYDLLKEYYVNKNMPPSLIAKELNCPAGPIRRKVKDWNLDKFKTEEEKRQCRAKAYSVILSKFSSKAEEELQKLYPTSVTNDSTIIGLELDLYYPDKRIGIEYNGDYWHCTLHPRNSGLHLAKLAFCENKHIRLINIFERDWLSMTREKVIYHLDRLLKPEEQIKIKGDVSDVPLWKQKNFEKNYNFENFIETEYCVGTYFTPTCLCNSVSYNIHDNACYIVNYTTKAGFEEDYTELFRYIKEKHNLPIILTCDLRYYNEEFPEKHGFKFLKEIEPELYYVLNTKAKRKEEATKEYLDNPKCYPVYDCGRTQWIL